MVLVPPPGLPVSEHTCVDRLCPARAHHRNRCPACVSLADRCSQKGPPVRGKAPHCANLPGVHARQLCRQSGLCQHEWPPADPWTWPIRGLRQPAHLQTLLGWHILPTEISTRHHRQSSPVEPVHLQLPLGMSTLPRPPAACWRKRMLSWEPGDLGDISAQPIAGSGCWEIFISL